MKYIDTLDELHALYGTPGDASLHKVANQVTPEYRAWIERSRFCVLTTVGPNGTDGSPRGDVDPVVRVLDENTLVLPDWRGNQRLDSLRNIVRDQRVALMFMVAGSNTVIRVNGSARLTDDEQMCLRFEQKGRHPATVILISIGEIYSQCARALLRADLWKSGDQSQGLPSIGDILSALTEGKTGGTEYDREWPGRAAKTMW